MGQGFLTNRSQLTPLEGGVGENYTDIEYYEVGFGVDIKFGDWVFLDAGAPELTVPYWDYYDPYTGPTILAMSDTRALMMYKDDDYPGYALFDISNGITLIDRITSSATTIEYPMYAPYTLVKASATKAVAVFQDDAYSSQEIKAQLISIAGDSITILDTTTLLEVAHAGLILECNDGCSIEDNVVGIITSSDIRVSYTPNVTSYSNKLRILDVSSGSIVVTDTAIIDTDMWMMNVGVSYNAGKVMAVYVGADADDDIRYKSYTYSSGSLSALSSGVLVSVNDDAFDGVVGIGPGPNDNFVVAHIDMSGSSYYLDVYSESAANVTHDKKSLILSEYNFTSVMVASGSEFVAIAVTRYNMNKNFDIMLFKKKSDNTLEFIQRFQPAYLAKYYHVTITPAGPSRFLVAFYNDDWGAAILDISIKGGLRVATPEDSGENLLGVAGAGGGSGTTIPVIMAY